MADRLVNNSKNLNRIRAGKHASLGPKQTRKYVTSPNRAIEDAANSSRNFETQPSRLSNEKLNIQDQGIHSRSQSKLISAENEDIKI